MTPSTPSAALAVLAVALACALPLAAQAQGRPDLVARSLADPQIRHVAGELLVQFRPDASEARKAVLLSRIDGSLVQKLRERRADTGDLHLVRFRAPLAIADALARLNGEAGIDFAEPNWIYTTQETSDDPYFVNGSLYGMYGASTTPSNPFGSGAADAWSEGKTCDTDVVIGVIDEGAMFYHQDLRGQFPPNAFDPRDGVDNDGNGYVDDVYGWDWNANDRSVFDGTVDDHGTHVAGTIGAKGGNGKGVVGVCWNISMISGKFLGPSGGTTANAVLAIDYMTDRKSRHGLNLVATSNSWGGGGFSSALKDAIDRAGAADILFVAAAGNQGSNTDSSPHYPSSYDSPNIISVAAIDSSGNLASFSNYGRTTVDLGAPGVGIWSTLPSSRWGSTYGSYNGTSMATPHVSGAVAMYASLNPGATAAQIKAAILAATIPTASLNGRTVTGGRLDVSGF
jgi:subtilisin family serine protease